RSRVESRFELEKLGDRVPLSPRLVPASRRLEERAQVRLRHGAVGRRHRLEELVPRIFFVRIVLKLTKCSSDLLRAHRHPEKTCRRCAGSINRSGSLFPSENADLSLSKRSPTLRPPMLRGRGGRHKLRVQAKLRHVCWGSRRRTATRNTRR